MTKFTNKCNESIVSFEDIEIGTIFRALDLPDTFFIKMSLPEDNEDYESFNALVLNEGCLSYFEDFEQIEIVREVIFKN